VGRFTFAFLIATGLLLTTYFGLVAWRISDDRDPVNTGHIPPQAYGWKPTSTN
jgi:hypothetical protein